MNIEYKGEINGKPIYIGTYHEYVEVGTTRMSVINGLLFNAVEF